MSGKPTFGSAEEQTDDKKKKTFFPRLQLLFEIDSFAGCVLLGG